MTTRESATPELTITEEEVRQETVDAVNVPV
jgi:hypothetical protein